MSDLVRDLLRYIDASPTPYHAVAETARRLGEAGFSELFAEDPWSLSPGQRGYVRRGGGSLIAFEIGARHPVDGGFRIVGAHTDSPNLRLKPKPDLLAHGYRQIAVEPYGGLLLHTWLDRDLSIAGRVTFGARESGVRSALLDFGRPLVRIPNLAIHLNRDIRTEGLKLNEQTHALPILGMEGVPDVRELLATELRAQAIGSVSPDDILGFDLMLYDTNPSGVAGAEGEFIHAPRLDNLASCHAGTAALCAADRAALPECARVLVLYDHEEVGSRSATGAAGPILAETLERIVLGFKGGEPQGLSRALARSMLISADMAHAVHPNYADRHDGTHRPLIGHGPVIKSNANLAYATDAPTAAIFADLCRRADVEPQHFVSRNDLACGSTIGPISAARVGIPTVDVGNPMLSMHSCREMAGTADVEPMIEILQLYYEGSGAPSSCES